MIGINRVVMIKSEIRRNPVLFKLWYYLYRKNRGVTIDFFRPETVLYLDGYPRSGNTYSLHLIRSLWPDIHFVHHFHAIAPIKIALRRNIPVYILVREPLNSITSWYLKELSMKGKGFNENELSVSKLSSLAKDYEIYYKWVQKNLLKLRIVDFNRLTKEPEYIMLKINASLPKQYMLSDIELNSKLATVRNSSFGAKDKLGASLPTPEKETAKLILKERLLTMDVYNECLAVYEELREK